MPDNTNDNLTSIYQAHCKQYENLMTRRFSLLTIVPGATVASFAITLFSNPTNSGLTNLILPLGLAGTCFIIGLFFVARISLKEGRVIYDKILDIEARWGEGETRYQDGWLFSQQNVASLIFAASFAGWICVALWFFLGSTIAITTSIILFFIMLILSIMILHYDMPKGNRPTSSSQYPRPGSQVGRATF